MKIKQKSITVIHSLEQKRYYLSIKNWEFDSIRYTAYDTSVFFIGISDDEAKQLIKKEGLKKKPIAEGYPLQEYVDKVILKAELYRKRYQEKLYNLIKNA